MKFIHVKDPKYPDTYVNIETITHIEPIREGVTKIFCSMKINHYLMISKEELMDYLTSKAETKMLEVACTYDFAG